MIHLFELMELQKLKAISTKFQPTEESIWRSIKREYSKTFSVSLLEVSNLDPEEILLDLYEDQLDGADLDDEKLLQRILDNLYRIEDPDYDDKKEQEEKLANERILKEEEELQKKKVAKKAAKLKNTSVKKEPVQEISNAGGINLSYLAENAESEG
jgi:hypothetical protein